MTAEARPGGPLLVAGIGDMVFSRDPGAMLVAYGLGSCVGLSAWDPVSKVGGLAHFMLPGGPTDPSGPPAKFVAGGFERFIAGFRAAGGLTGRAQLKAAGGASMLQLLSGGLQIGNRNAEAVQSAVSAAGLHLVATDLGGNAGRTVHLEVASGNLLVKSVSKTATL